MASEKNVGRELGRAVAALPPTLRTIFLRCGDPTPDNLARLVAEVPEGERGHVGEAAAVAGLLDLFERQAILQRQRHRRQEREKAYLAALLSFEEFPMPRPRTPA